jgi:plastocyanin
MRIAPKPILVVIFLLIGVNIAAADIGLQPEATVQIDFTCCIYTPPARIIPAGDTIVWQGDFLGHPLVSEDGLWATQSSGTEFSYTFANPGNYRFYCALHGGPGGIGMSGEVTVFAPERAYLPLTVRPEATEE